MTTKLRIVTAMAAGAMLMASAANVNAAPARHKRAVRRSAAGPAVTAADVRELRDALAAQQRQIQALQQQLQQRDTVFAEAGETARQAQTAAADAASKAAAVESVAGQNAAAVTEIQSGLTDIKQNQTNIALSAQDDQKKIAAVESYLSRFRLSGDVRVRGESFFQSYPGCAACFDRNRARIRLRLGLEGKLNEDFTAGMYIATGGVVNGAPSFTDPISTNETLTSFFERKTIGFDRGWITYNPSAHKWLSLTGGKFAYSWNRTPLTFDSDLNPEGFNEKVSRELANRYVKSFTAQGLQLLFNEVAAGIDSNALGGSFSSKLQLGSRVSIVPTYTVLNWNSADAIAQAASPVTLPQPVTPAPGSPLPTPVTQPVRIINANAFTNASRIVGVGAAQKRAFVSGFMYSDFIADTNVVTPWKRYPFRLIAEYEQNLRAKANLPTTTSKQDKAYWFDGSFGQQKDKHDLLVGYAFARIEQDAVISQFNESDLRAATNVVQHRAYVNWLIEKNTTAGLTWWVGRTLNANLQNAARAPGLPAGAQDPFLNRLQFDLIYKF